MAPMKTAAVAAPLLALLLSVSLAAQQQTPQGSIEGIVLRGDANEPVSGAVVLVSPMPLDSNLRGLYSFALSAGVIGNRDALSISEAVKNLPPASPSASAQMPVPLPEARTGGDGRFAFKDLPNGLYRVGVSAPGFAWQERGRTIQPEQGTYLYVNSAMRPKEDLTVRMMASGTITGRILNEAGQPAVGVPIQLLKAEYGPQGQRATLGVGTAIADDRGEYRIFSTPPGEYLLAAGEEGGSVLIEAYARTLGSSRTQYTLSFYPGVAEIEKASRLKLAAGAEVRADLMVQRTRGYSISGRLIDAATGLPPANASIFLSNTLLRGGMATWGSGNSYDPRTGTFQLSNVPPGRYHIEASLPAQSPNRGGAVDPAAARARISANFALPRGRTPVEVRDSDLDGIVVRISPAAPLPARFVVEEPLAALPPLQETRIQMRPSLRGVPQAVVSGMGVLPPNAQGVFHLEGVREGEYLIEATPPEGFYVKAIRFEGRDLPGQSLTISGPTQGPLEVVLSSKGGEVRGKTSVPVSMVVLVPEGERKPLHLYRTTVAGFDGTFSLSAIVPGNYKLFAWESLEPFGYFDPEVIKRFEEQGVAISVSESSSQDLQLRSIP
jgi:hypothetical protein